MQRYLFLIVRNRIIPEKILFLWKIGVALAIQAKLDRGRLALFASLMSI